MQERHHNPAQYFKEGAESSRDHYIPYITAHTSLQLAGGCRVLEVGCGLGGSLSVFAERGCATTGVDLSEESIEWARRAFAERGLKGAFQAADIFEYHPDGQYDLIMLHDAIEHIPHKERLMEALKAMLAPGGIIFIGFPAWQMPFGGHQQMAQSRVLSRFPWLHLLPEPLFGAMFKAFGRNGDSPEGFRELRETGISIEQFERLAAASGLEIIHRKLWLVNPHYHAKFGLHPRALPRFISAIPRLRNYFSTSCFYLLTAPARK